MKSPNALEASLVAWIVWKACHYCVWMCKMELDTKQFVCSAHTWNMHMDGLVFKHNNANLFISTQQNPYLSITRLWCFVGRCLLLNINLLCWHWLFCAFNGILFWKYLGKPTNDHFKFCKKKTWSITIIVFPYWFCQSTSVGPSMAKAMFLWIIENTFKTKMTIKISFSAIYVVMVFICNPRSNWLTLWPHGYGRL